MLLCRYYSIELACIATGGVLGLLLGVFYTLKGLAKWLLVGRYGGAECSMIDLNPACLSNLPFT